MRAKLDEDAFREYNHLKVDTDIVCTVIFSMKDFQVTGVRAQ